MARHTRRGRATPRLTSPRVSLPSPAARVHSLVMALPTACDRLFTQIAGLLAEREARYRISSIQQVGMTPSLSSPQRKAVPTSISLHSKPRERSGSLSGWTTPPLQARQVPIHSRCWRLFWLGGRPRSKSTSHSTPQLPFRLPAGVVGAPPASTLPRWIRTGPGRRVCTKPPCCFPSWSAWSTRRERTRNQSRRPRLSPPEVPVTGPGAGGRRQLTSAYLVWAERRFRASTPSRLVYGRARVL